MQVIIATAIIYILCLALPERIPPLRLLQAVLYVDGAYLVVSAALSVPISYLDLTLRIPTANRELDIFGTEFERCMADNSMFYWLLRGDIKFFLYNDVWKPQDWANWFFDNYDYVLIIPFIFIFAITLRPARKIRLILICVFAAIGYIAAVESTNFVKGRLGRLMATQDTKCKFGYLDQVTTKYAPDLIARQIAYKINNDSLKANQFFAPLVVRDTTFLLASQIKTQCGANLASSRDRFLRCVRQAYCTENNAYWVAMRRINYRLHLIVYDKDDALQYQQLFTPGIA